MLIKSATFQISAPDLPSCPPSELPEFAFIGRSNVGKSSLLNLLAGAKALAKVSSTPGHTKLINFFAINQAWTLVDLPGYGYAQTGKEQRLGFQDMIGRYLTGRPNLACVFVLIDSRHEPQPIDVDFTQWLIENAVPFVLVFTKTDLVKPKALQRNIALFQERLADFGQSPPDVFTSSSKGRSGRPELLDFIEKALP